MAYLHQSFTFVSIYHLATTKSGYQSPSLQLMYSLQIFSFFIKITNRRIWGVNFILFKIYQLYICINVHRDLNQLPIASKDNALTSNLLIPNTYTNECNMIKQSSIKQELLIFTKMIYRN
uniref:SJCHGC04500 protein n=1 Tax=Schistosoma japonicum TaxID=6182 RepID=Q5DFA8_SCHJA|nr:SJCHGC04500 protein [Schistosoma japonicum]